ncbi:MAG: CDP-glycerol glycerophosphotransferase family protein [Chloroflexota bacterium]
MPDHRLPVRRRRVARTLLARLGFAIGRRLPLRRRVVLAVSHAPRPTGNLAIIGEELRRRHPDLEVVTVSMYRPARFLGRFAPLLGAVRSGYHLATARVVVVDDYYFPMYVVRPRPGTMRIQVWHAAGAFKMFGYSVVAKRFGADLDMIRHVRLHSNYSLALVSSMSVARHYAEAFDQPPGLFTSRIGFPRADILVDPARKAAGEARARAAFPGLEGRTVVLYAPTFRGETIGRARYEDLLDLEELHRVLGDGYAVLLRRHPFVRERPMIPQGLEGFAIEASAYPDVNELMLISDILVTDYSSVIYEFALLGRPILFLAPDEQAYELERGFYFDFRAEAPGLIVETTSALAAVIRDGVFDLERVRAFARASFDVADGNATRRLVEEVIMPALAGETVTAATLEAPATGRD